ncbi:ER lumen protein-retaining receptor A [Glycine soja]
MNIFKLSSDMTHIFSILVLLLKIYAIKSCSGLFTLHSLSVSLTVPMVRRSYDRELDTFRHYFLVGASFALTLILHEKFIVQEYLNHFVSTKRLMYERFALLFSMASAWLLAKLLTSSTAYNHKPKSTQNSCRTDRVGLIIGYECHCFDWTSPNVQMPNVGISLAHTYRKNTWGTPNVVPYVISTIVFLTVQNIIWPKIPTTLTLEASMMKQL